MVKPRFFQKGSRTFWTNRCNIGDDLQCIESESFIYVKRPWERKKSKNNASSWCLNIAAIGVTTNWSIVACMFKDSVSCWGSSIKKQTTPTHNLNRVSLEILSCSLQAVEPKSIQLQNVFEVMRTWTIYNTQSEIDCFIWWIFTGAKF